MSEDKEVSICFKQPLELDSSSQESTNLGSVVAHMNPDFPNKQIR